MFSKVVKSVFFISAAAFFLMFVYWSGYSRAFLQGQKIEFINSLEKGLHISNYLDTIADKEDLDLLRKTLKVQLEISFMVLEQKDSFITEFERMGLASSSLEVFKLNRYMARLPKNNTHADTVGSRAMVVKELQVMLDRAKNEKAE